jgi:6-phosphogluconate dehydrogenase (decarboxylating)
VSGGPGGAEAGTLTVMMGGNPVTVGRVKPLLQNFSTNIVHFGDIGERPLCLLFDYCIDSFLVFPPNASY